MKDRDYFRKVQRHILTKRFGKSVAHQLTTCNTKSHFSSNNQRCHSKIISRIHKSHKESLKAYHQNTVSKRASSTTFY